MHRVSAAAPHFIQRPRDGCGLRQAEVLSGGAGRSFRPIALQNPELVLIFRGLVLGSRRPFWRSLRDTALTVRLSGGRHTGKSGRLAPLGLLLQVEECWSGKDGDRLVIEEQVLRLLVRMVRSSL